MKPIAVQRSWEKNSRVGRSFWLLSRIGQRFGAFRKGRVKPADPQRPLLFWGIPLLAEGINILDASTAVVRCELNCCAMSNVLLRCYVVG